MSLLINNFHATQLWSCSSFRQKVLVAGGALTLTACAVIFKKLVIDSKPAPLRLHSPSLYRTIHLSLDVEDHQKAFKKALVRFQQHPFYLFYIQSLVLKEELPDKPSKEDVILFFKNELNEGVCRGASLCMVRLLRTNNLQFTENSKKTFNMEEVFYKQLYSKKISCMMKILALHFELQICAAYDSRLQEYLAENKSLKESLTKLNEQIQTSEEMEATIEDINENVYFPTGLYKSFERELFHSKSRKFTESLSPDTYRNEFKTFINTAVDHSLETVSNSSITGLISTPIHVMAFAYSENKYLIFDPYKGWVHEYPDEESFFEGMQYLVQKIKNAWEPDEEKEFKVQFKC